jgi:hypothetical protein
MDSVMLVLIPGFIGGLLLALRNALRNQAAVPCFVALLAILVSPASVRAQTVFAGGGAATNSVWFSHTESQSPAIINNDTSGRVTDWFVIAGGRPAKHAVLQVELSFGSKLKTDIPQPQYVPGFPSIVGTQVTSYTYRFRSGGVLGGYTTGTSRRVNVSALAGVVFIQTRRDYYSQYTPPTPSPLPSFPSQDKTFVYSIAPAFGLDVPITVVPHVALVPQVRTWKIPAAGPLSISFGLGARLSL